MRECTLLPSRLAGDGFPLLAAQQPFEPLELHFDQVAMLTLIQQVKQLAHKKTAVSTKVDTGVGGETSEELFGEHRSHPWRISLVSAQKASIGW